jgi:hypothetical protein
MRSVTRFGRVHARGAILIGALGEMESEFVI